MALCSSAGHFRPNRRCAEWCSCSAGQTTPAARTQSKSAGRLSALAHCDNRNSMYTACAKFETPQLGGRPPCITFGRKTHCTSGFVQHCSQAKACGHPQHHLAAPHALWQDSPECERMRHQQHCLLCSSSLCRPTLGCRATAAVWIGFIPGAHPQQQPLLPGWTDAWAHSWVHVTKHGSNWSCHVVAGELRETRHAVPIWVLPVRPEIFVIQQDGRNVRASWEFGCSLLQCWRQLTPCSTHPGRLDYSSACG